MVRLSMRAKATSLSKIQEIGPRMTTFKSRNDRALASPRTQNEHSFRKRSEARNPLRKRVLIAPIPTRLMKGLMTCGMTPRGRA
jgi:hypothetical protein